MNAPNEATTGSTISGIGLLVSIFTTVAFINGIGVPGLSSAGYIYGVLLYLGGLTMGYGWGKDD